MAVDAQAAERFRGACAHGASADAGAALEVLLDHAVESGLIQPADRIWARNTLLEVLQLSAPAADTTGAGTAAADTTGTGAGAAAGDAVGSADDADAAPSLEDILRALADDACARGVVPDTTAERDRLSCRLMGLLTPRPSQVEARWGELMARDAQAATRWFHQLSVDAGYVRLEAAARDIRWNTETRWGTLELSINRSKPEKDPRDIARAAAVGAGTERDASCGPAPRPYPACQLCRENVGYAGRSASERGGAHPARQNLRMVPLPLQGDEDPWYLQYSPYRYYEEHCIALNPRHVPMHVDRRSLERLLDCVGLLPHYFMGSNADLPIVGGSILTHDHFQGGRHRFPMDRAQVVERFEVTGFPQVEAGVVQWPTSVLRLRSTEREALLDAAVRVLEAWRGYDDASVGIVSHSGAVAHNTVTPIAHRDEGGWRLDLALRCNVTSEEHPLGVFHPHAELHHLKKENIGLIEVMGLAILPARLVPELQAVRAGLLNGADLTGDPLTAKHAAWAAQVADRHPELDETDAQNILRDEVGLAFARVLEDTGVFKWDDAGRAAMDRFLEEL